MLCMYFYILDPYLRFLVDQDFNPSVKRKFGTLIFQFGDLGLILILILIELIIHVASMESA